MRCEVCGAGLRQKRVLESHTGAIHEEVRCPRCGAAGVVIANPQGPRSLRRHGRAVKPEGRGENPVPAVMSGGWRKATNR